MNSTPVVALLLLAALTTGCQHQGARSAPSCSSLPSPSPSPSPSCSCSLPSSSPADLVWPDLDRLRADADARWAAGRRLEALLALEHAVALVMVTGVSEEGGHDYAVSCRVTELADEADVATLRALLADEAHFPQSHYWAKELLSQRPALARRVAAP